MISSKAQLFMTGVLAAGALAFNPATAQAADAKSETSRSAGTSSLAARAELSGSDTLAQRLVEMGADPGQANQAVGQLTQQDIEVLNQNPNMMQTAGEISTEQALLLIFGVTIIILLLVIAL